MLLALGNQRFSAMQIGPECCGKQHPALTTMPELEAIMAEAKLCSVEGCGKRVKGRGLCSAHGARLRKHGDPTIKIVRMVQHGTCKIEGCGSEANSSRSWLCHSHYKRQYRYGDPHGGPRGRRAKAGEPVLWLLAHVDHSGEGCLTWPFAHRGNGYGILTAASNQRAVSAHREMCRLAHGEPPSAKHLAAHSCGNGHLGCVNPRHLRWATPAENTADMIAHNRTLRGGRNANAKLSLHDVRAIRAAWPSRSQNELARSYGVHQSTIWKVLHRKVWSWV